MPRQGSIKKYVWLFVLLFLCGGIYLLLPEIEWKPPVIKVHLPSGYIGAKPFMIEVTDEGKGVKTVKVSLNDKYGEIEVLNRTFYPPARKVMLEVKIKPEKLGIKTEKATLRVIATDDSRIRVFAGNKSTFTRKVVLDFIPPRIELVSQDHYIKHGGSGIVIYKVFEHTFNTGVRIGTNFFPGVGGYFTDPNVYISFFAYPYNKTKAERVNIVAEDLAGNVTQRAFGYELQPRVFKESNIEISDRFINTKVLPLLDDSYTNQSNKDIFLSVNKDMRKSNNKKINEITSNSTPAILWNGPFHQLSNSKVEAYFADKRSYIYQGEKIDEQYHLGYDLAVVKRYPVEAANWGKVAFVGDLGIYGNSVIIDHGMGLFTLYSHLSSIAVEKGERVKKKEIIGRTGQTGLAGGDHLHYAVYVNGVSVHPLEWWDRSWLYENIIRHIEEAESRFGVSESNIGFLPKRNNN